MARSRSLDRSAQASSVRARSIGGTCWSSGRCERSLPPYQSSVSAPRASPMRASTSRSSVVAAT
ncbi:MAG: hypothetical protein QM820_39845 [Minicystis sp.]